MQPTKNLLQNIGIAAGINPHLFGFVYQSLQKENYLDGAVQLENGPFLPHLASNDKNCSH
jgi:hypothetical protein